MTKSCGCLLAEAKRKQLAEYRMEKGVNNLG